MDWIISHWLWIGFLLLTIDVQCLQREYTMDNPATCGQTITLYENTVILAARATVSNPNPPTSCAVTLNTGYTDTYYYIKIEQLAITIQDCAFVLNIFLGASAGGTPLKSFACRGSETTGITVAKSQTITVSLTQPRELFQPANTFTLRLTTYRDPDAPPIAEGTSNLPTGAIIGIVIALFALIAFAIIMCWCYKQGKLKFLRQEKAYDYRASNDTLTHKSINGSTNIYPESETSRNSPNSIKRHIDLENKEVWASLTNTPTSGRRQPRPVSIPVAPPVPQLGARLDSGKNEKNWEDSSYTSIDTDNVFMTMSGSPGRSRARSQANGGPDQLPRGRRPRKLDEDDSVTGVKARTSSFNNEGFNGDEKTDMELPRGRRPTASARNTKGGETDDQTGNRGSVHENMLEEELQRSFSLSESARERKVSEGGKETMIDDSQGSPTSKSSPRRSRKDGQVPEAVDTIDKKKYLAMDQHSGAGEGDIIENHLMRNNRALRSRTDESKRKRQKKKKYVSVHKDPNKGSKETLENSEDSLSEPPSDHYESKQFTSANTDNIPLPPEALPPEFATDQSEMQHYNHPNTQDQNANKQHRGIPVLVGYDANDFPVYSYVNPQMIGTPYMQLGPDGQPVQYDPNYPGYHIDQAGNYVRIAETSNLGHDPADGHLSGVIVPLGSVTPAGGLSYNSIIPAENILDDSQLSSPGATVVRSAVDPTTGSQVDHVVWAGITKYPIDRPTVEAQNPQITRKPKALVTTKAMEHKQQPTKPDPALQQITVNAANQIIARPKEEPSFLSPSKVKSKDLQQQYILKPIMTTNSPDITQFHTKLPCAEPHGIPRGPTLRDAPAKSQAFKDKITLSTQDDTEI